MKVCVIGLGYIGLPSSLMMAANGVDVCGIDYNKELVDMLKNGQVTFEEEGLPELFNKAVEKGIQFSSEYIPADMYIVAVPTPYDEQTKKIDASYVTKAVESVMEVCPKGAIVTIESTISPGTIDKFVRPVIEQKGFVLGEDLHIAHAPERIIPGNMIYELEYNSRTIGADDYSVGEKVREVYGTFCKGEIVITDIRTAEMSKVVENTFRDINIAYANELAKICRRDNLDVYEIIKIANMHPRVNILQPGPGVGGHCISVDPWFLVGDYPDLALIIKQAREINSSMPAFVLDRITEIMKENGISDYKRVGLYGLTYKEDVDDVRESPTLQLLDVMKERLGTLPALYDPMISKPMFPEQCMNFDEFIAGIDMMVVMVGHSHLKDNMEALDKLVVLDTRHICSKDGIYTL